MRVCLLLLFVFILILTAGERMEQIAFHTLLASVQFGVSANLGNFLF